MFVSDDAAFDGALRAHCELLQAHRDTILSRRPARIRVEDAAGRPVFIVETRLAAIDPDERLH